MFLNSNYLGWPQTVSVFNRSLIQFDEKIEKHR